MAAPEQSDPHRGSYRDAETHLVMLRDAVRTAAYYQAIHNAVTEDSRVIDFGTGTGTLAIFAARRGAAQVDAIERETIVSKARQIAAINGCSSIRFHHTEPSDFQTDGPADIIVSEWMGHCLFVESMLEPLLALRDRWLKPDGRMIPQAVGVHASLVTDAQVYEDLSFLQRRPWGIDYSPLADLPLRQSQVVHFEAGQLLSETVQLAQLDMKTLQRTPDKLQAILSVKQSATCYGIAAWFDAQVDDEVEFGTGPHDAETHWQQIFLPFPEPFEVHPERPITLCIKPPRCVEQGDTCWAWSASDGEQLVDINEAETIAATATL